MKKGDELMTSEVVCLCGSTRFLQTFREVERNETLKGNIVLSIGCDMRTDSFFADLPEEELERIKNNLDNLHLEKIDMANRVIILNVGGYIGESTQRELDYAKLSGKRISFLEMVN